jgi:hypothetical protein
MTALTLDAAPLSAGSSTLARWTSRVLTGIVVLFLTFDTVIHLVPNRMVIEGSAALGFKPETMFTIGVIELVCLIVYLIPRTAPLGAILFTGYLGGAIVTHLRLGNPLFSHILFPIYVAALLWGGLYLRDARVRALIQPAR